MLWYSGNSATKATQIHQQYLYGSLPPTQLSKLLYNMAIAIDDYYRDPYSTAFTGTCLSFVIIAKLVID